MNAQSALSALGKRWLLPEPPTHSLPLAREHHLHPLVAELLWQRGYRENEAVQAFLDPRLQSMSDPFLVTDLKLAAERMQTALEQKQRIVIFGDYDVDGITSSALLHRVLKKLGAQVKTFLPLRMEEGYGLSQEGVERCVEQHQPQLLIAVDCGTTAVAQIAWLRAHGVEVIVIDHHALPSELPDAVALVNPQRDGRLTYLASVGLVFKVCHGLLKLDPARQKQIDLRELLDLVAIGTVADIVPLVEENRIFVRRGLKQLEQTVHVGLRALLEVGQVSFPVTAQDVGFRLGPRLNASGRLGDAMRSLRLLQTEDKNEAFHIAEELNKNNRDRQTVEMQTVLQAEALLQENYDPARDWAIVLSGQHWHWGVIGIVASRLQKRYHRPTLIIGLDDENVGKGSGRSIEGISLVQALAACQEHLVSFGGHDMAAGVNLRADQVEAFREKFIQAVRAQVTVEEVFQSSLKISGSLTLEEIDEDLYRQMDQLAPFGRENMEPILHFKNPRFTRPAKIFGKNHVKLFVRTGAGETEIVGFGFGGPEHDWTRTPRELVGVLDWDDYRNQVQLRLLDWRWA